MNKKMNEFSNIEIDEIIEQHNRGIINKEITKNFNTSPTMISRLLLSNQVVSKHPSLTLERKLLIKECYESNLNKMLTCELMHCGYDTLKSIIKEYNLHEKSMSEIKRKYMIDENYFNVIDTPNKAYSLGILFADGTVNKNMKLFEISLQETDKDVIDKLNHEFGGDRKLTYLEYNKKNSNWQNQYMLAISNKQMCIDLVKHGCVPNKSLILQFPNTISDNLIRHFIRGYFEGDGNISKNEDRCTLISTNDFCTKLSEIIKKELNINSSIMYCKDKTKSTRVFQVAGKRQVKKFLDWLYKDADIYMNRKHDLYILKYHNTNNSLSE